MKIRPVGAELFHADRRKGGLTDMTNLTVAFCNFAKAPKNYSQFKEIMSLSVSFINFRDVLLMHVAQSV
jgi:hypothetical protein